MKQIHETVAEALELELYGREQKQLLGKPPQIRASGRTVSVSYNPQGDSGCGLFIHGFYYVETLSFWAYFVLSGFITKGRG